jgi:hypothetical protein
MAFGGGIMSRFFDKVEMEPNSGCWLWAGGVTSHGYGMFFDGDKVVKAHRFSAGVHGLSLDRLICHKCNNRGCVNPDHLYSGSYADNLHDANRDLNRYGENRWNAKLTWQEVDEMRERAANGDSCYALAKEYNINIKTAYRVIKMLTWRVRK